MKRSSCPWSPTSGRGPVAASVGERRAWSIGDVDGKLAAAAARRPGRSARRRRPCRPTSGDTGAAAALLGVGALRMAERRHDRRGRLRRRAGHAPRRSTWPAPVPGAAGALAASAPVGAVTYTEALRARGQLVAMVDPMPMGVPPASAAFVRGAPEMLALEGARCGACGTISTPPSIHPRCIALRGRRPRGRSPLARRGRVETFVVNQTMPPPFQAPLPLIVLDLDDGARLMLQGMPGRRRRPRPSTTTVELALRRYAVERHIPVYGYKALRAPGRRGARARGGAASAQRHRDEGSGR